jgi:hypothetical protein
MLAWVLVIVFVCSGLAAAAGCVAAFRQRSRYDDSASSLASSTGAAVPGTLLLAETGVRLLQRWLVPATVLRPYEFASVPLCVLWILVGPCLFLGAFLLRVRPIQRGILLLQLSQVLCWGSSSLMALWFASSV